MIYLSFLAYRLSTIIYIMRICAILGFVVVRHRNRMLLILFFAQLGALYNKIFYKDTKK